jgi:NAD(P)-dependent dehydrogenase (short-subunit alcohol dehydrogenase family)
MKPSKLYEALHALIGERVPLHIWGACGVGKSQIVHQVGDDLDYDFLDVRAVQLAPVDSRGLPRISAVQTEWVPPKFLPTSGKGILFLNELTSAPQMTQAGCYQLVKQTVAAFGRLDAAYNNAGVQNVLAETADTTREDYDRVMGINLRGVWNCMKFELQQMRKQGSGAIVNCSSIGGRVGGAERGIYHAAKHGVIGFTRSAALEYAARGIRVNAVCPGLIWTPMADQMVAAGQGEVLKSVEKSVPMGRVGRPEEIADAVLWLSSDAASYVTGQSISVDGGMMMP